MSLKITEIFKSIQGESTFQGSPTIFIRTAECNLRCAYCDTSYSFDSGSNMSIEKILEHCAKWNIDLVELTGGEPLVQPDSIELMHALLQNGYRVMLETNGSFSIKDVPEQVVIILDLKSPGSGMDLSNCYENIPLLKPNDEIKFVLTSREDYDWAVKKIRELSLEGKKILFSAVSPTLPVRDLADWIVKDELPVRLNMQLHKYIWGDERGK